MFLFCLIALSVCVDVTARTEVKTETHLAYWDVRLNAYEGWNGGAINAYPNPDGGGVVFNLTLTSCTFNGCKTYGCASTEQGYGGAVCCRGAGLIMSECQFIECSSCWEAGGAVYVDTFLQAVECRFDRCSTTNGQGGALAFNSSTNPAPTCIFRDCQVLNCATQGQSVLYFTGIGSFEFSGNGIRDCTSSGHVLYASATDMVFRSNTVSLSVTGERALQLHVGNVDKAVEIVDCDFANDNQEMDYFLHIGTTGSIRYVNCSFDKLNAKRGGAGIFISKDEDIQQLDVVDCNFTNLVCVVNGAGIYVKMARWFSIKGCVFDSCRSTTGYTSPNGNKLGGSGGVYIEYGVGDGEISGCVFRNNNSPMNGQSLQVMLGPEPLQKIDIFDCTFTEHRVGSIFCYCQYTDGGASAITASPHMLTLTNLSFIGNTLEQNDYGLVSIQSTKGMEFNKCIFKENNGGSDGLLGTCSSTTDRPICKFIECEFSECTGNPDVGIIFFPNNYQACEILINDCDFKSSGCSVVKMSVAGTNFSVLSSRFDGCTLSGYSSTLFVGNIERMSELKVAGCTFSSCTSESSAAALWIGTDDADSVSIELNSFVSCYGKDPGSVVDISSNNLVFTGNVFKLSLTKNNAISISQMGSQLLVEDCIFSNSDANIGNAFIQTASTSARFENCSIENIHSNHYSGLSFSIDRLELVFCNFSNLESEGDSGSALHGGETHQILVDNCRFESCHCVRGWGEYGGSGGIYVQGSGDQETNELSVLNCTFVANRCEKFGQSIHIYQYGYGDKPILVTISDCIFTNHDNRDSIVSVVTDRKSQTFPGDVTLTRCSFVDNQISEPCGFGLVNATIFTSGVIYDQCTFANNRDDGGLLSVGGFGTSSPRHQFIECDFSECNSTVGILFFPTNSRACEILINDCDFKSSKCSVVQMSVAGTNFSVLSSRFDGCTVAGSVLLAGSIQPISTLLVTNCSFVDCTSEGKAAIVHVSAGECDTAEINSCQLLHCRGYSEASVLYLECNSLTFTSNVINHSAAVTNVLHIRLGNEVQEMEISLSTFANNGEKVQGRYLDISNTDIAVSFVNCCFESIGSSSGGGALKLSVARLLCTDCEFRQCFCVNDGGAVHGQDTKDIIIDGCTFE